MILGWVDQICRKGNIVCCSSCSLSFVPLSVYLTKEFTYEKKTQFPEQFQNNLFITNLLPTTLPIRKKISSVTNLISSPSLLPIPVASPYKYFHHRYLLVSFRLSFPVYSRYLPPRFETYLFVSILESKPNGDFLKHLLIHPI